MPFGKDIAESFGELGAGLGAVAGETVKRRRKQKLKDELLDSGVLDEETAALLRSIDAPDFGDAAVELYKAKKSAELRKDLFQMGVPFKDTPEEKTTRAIIDDIYKDDSISDEERAIRLNALGVKFNPSEETKSTTPAERRANTEVKKTSAILEKKGQVQKDVNTAQQKDIGTRQKDVYGNVPASVIFREGKKKDQAGFEKGLDYTLETGSPEEINEYLDTEGAAGVPGGRSSAAADIINRLNQKQKRRF